MKIFKDKGLNIKIAIGLAAGMIGTCAAVMPVYAHGDDPAESTETAAEMSTEVPVVSEETSTEESSAPADTVSGNSSVVTGPEKPLTPEGNMTLVDDIGSTTKAGKQFITCTTKDGNYFYIVIDRDDNGNENVHFMNLVDESDLLALMDEDDVKAYNAAKAAAAGGEEKETEETKETAAETAEETEAAEPEKKETGSASAAFLVIVLLGAGGYFVYKKLSEKKKKEAEKPDPDLDYVDEDDDYEYPEDEKGSETADKEDTEEETDSKDTE